MFYKMRMSHQVSKPVICPCQQTQSITYPGIINGSVTSTNMTGSLRLFPEAVLSDTLQRGRGCKDLRVLTMCNKGTNLWVFENLVFLPALFEEDFVLGVPRPR